MTFTKTSDRKYKVGRDAKGSNQYQRIIKKRRYPRFRAILALITLVTLGISILYLNKTHQAQASEVNLTQPVVSGESAVLRIEPSTEVEEFMRLQHEWNKTAQEWMKTQEFLNQAEELQKELAK